MIGDLPGTHSNPHFIAEIQIDNNNVKYLLNST